MASVDQLRGKITKTACGPNQANGALHFIQHGFRCRTPMVVIWYSPNTVLRGSKNLLFHGKFIVLCQSLAGNRVFRWQFPLPVHQELDFVALLCTQTYEDDLFNESEWAWQHRRTDKNIPPRSKPQSRRESRIIPWIFSRHCLTMWPAIEGAHNLHVLVWIVYTWWARTKQNENEDKSRGIRMYFTNWKDKYSSARCYSI